MASKRMFALEIVDTDDFLEMPAGSRLLYFDLGMRADDEGFVGDAKKIMKFTGAADDDIKILIAKSYVIPFESGVVAIAHWHTNNMVRKDRAKPTRYREEREQLIIAAGVYIINTGCEPQKINDSDTENSLLPDFGCQSAGNCPSNDRVGKVRLGEDSIGEVRLEESRREEDKERFGPFGNVSLAPSELRAIVERYYNPHLLIERVDTYLANAEKSYRSHAALIYKIAREDNWPRRTSEQSTEAASDLCRALAERWS